ncbi:MAG: hypothetical protein ACI9CD_001230, partial [Candidatus Deianiraeaceae bacterium]
RDGKAFRCNFDDYDRAESVTPVKSSRPWLHRYCTERCIIDEGHRGNMHNYTYFGTGERFTYYTFARSFVLDKDNTYGYKNWKNWWSYGGTNCDGSGDWGNTHGIHSCWFPGICNCVPELTIWYTIKVVYKCNKGDNPDIITQEIIPGYHHSSVPTPEYRDIRLLDR